MNASIWGPAFGRFRQKKKQPLLLIFCSLSSQLTKLFRAHFTSAGPSQCYPWRPPSRFSSPRVSALALYRNFTCELSFLSTSASTAPQHSPPARAPHSPVHTLGNLCMHTSLQVTFQKDKKSYGAVISAPFFLHKPTTPLSIQFVWAVKRGHNYSWALLCQILRESVPALTVLVSRGCKDSLTT